MLYLYFYIFIILFLIVKIYYKRKVFILSPVDIFNTFFFLAIIFTLLYHFYYPQSKKFNLFNLDRYNIKNIVNQVNVFLRMIMLFLFGVFFYESLNLGYYIRNRQSIQIINTDKFKINYILINKLTVVVLILSVLLVYIDYGNDLFVRKDYIPKDSSMLKTIYLNLLIFLSVLSGVLLRKNTFLSLLSLFAILLIGISLGSRMATIDLLVFFITYSVFIKKKKDVLIYYLFVIPFITLFFGFNLSLRSESSGHGLLPYIRSSLNNPSVILEYAIENIYYTFVFGFYATSETIKLYNENFGKLLTCISPLPGRMTDWYIISDNMRINKFAPFTAIGELSKFPIFSFFYYLFLGLFFAYCDNFIKKSILNKKYLTSILLVLFLSLMIVLSYEYNLRASNRFIYYSVFVLFLSIFVNKFSKIKFVWKNDKK